MTGLLVLASGIITLAAGAVYMIHARREHGPKVASFIAWTALTAVGAVSSLAAGQIPAAVYLLADAAMSAATIALIVRRGDWAPDPLDWVCLAGAAAGLALLVLARSPALATAATVIADLFAVVPVTVHAWRRPREEPWAAFAGWAAGAALALIAALAAGQYGITAIAYPAYLLLATGAVAVILLARRARRSDPALSAP